MDRYAKELTWISEAKEIEVPFFQRPYVWDDDDFTALIDSILDAPKNTMPFFGSVIFKSVGTEDSTTYLVIDGQQRLTTFTILIRVLLDMIEIGTFSLSTTVLNMLRITVYNIEIDDDDNEIFSTKLIPSNSDKAFYNKVMDASNRKS